MRFYLLAFFSLFAMGMVSAQEFSYLHYNRKDGLAGSIVYCAAEDKDGFLWFGTENGVSRFDGTQFQNFTTADGLPDNEVLRLFVDSRNRVWMLPFKNSVCYYLKGKLHNPENDLILRQLAIGSAISSISEDKYGNIIMTDPRNVYIVSPDQKVKKIDRIDGRQLQVPVGGGLNRDSLFIFFTAVDTPEKLSHLYTFNGSYFLMGGKRQLAGNSCNTSILSPAVNVFRNKDDLFFYPETGRLFTVAIPRNFINISKIDDSLFAVNTSGGAVIYNILTKQVVSHFLKNQSVNAVFRDSEDNLWFMCAGNGVFKIGSLAFHHRFFRDKEHNLSVNCIQKIDSFLYIGTEHSLLWRTNLSLQNVCNKRLNGHIVSRGGILAIAPINKNNLLLGTDMGLKTLENFNICRAIEELTVKTITTGDNFFLVSAMQRVKLFRRGDCKPMDVLWEGRSTCSWSNDSLFYIGTISGLYTIDLQRRKYFLGNDFPIFKNRIADIKVSPDGVVWIATSGQGMAGYKDGRLLYNLTEKDGLSSNICRTIFIAGKDVWVGTDNGISRIRQDGNHFQVTKYTDADGLSSAIVNTIYVEKNIVYVGTTNGLTYFNIEDISTSSFCKLRVTAIKATDRVWTYDTSGLVLPHHKNSIRVEYVGISYRSAGNILYRYRLKGLSDVWQTTRETFLSYPTLPSGKYTLEIVATNKFGIQSEPLQIVFTVEKLFWEKTWVIIVLTVVSGCTIWFFVAMRIRAIRMQNKEKLSTNNRIAELEQMALKAQMNPHFIFNSLNSIQKYVIDKDIIGANKFITDFSRLIRFTLEMSAQSKISIDEEVKYLDTYLQLEKARFGNVFGYRIEVDPAIDRSTYCIPPMILQPYIENSIRHGVRYLERNTGKINIHFIKNDNYLVCTIEDNGIGRKQAQQYKSLMPVEYQSRGMTLTARRLEMMNKTQAVPIVIEIEDLATNDQQPAGTRVAIYFPLQHVINY
jgi:hypothetical protein